MNFFQTQKFILRTFFLIAIRYNSILPEVYINYVIYIPMYTRYTFMTYINIQYKVKVNFELVQYSSKIKFIIYELDALEQVF